MPNNNLPKTPSEAARKKARASLNNYYGTFPAGWSGTMKPEMREDVPWMPKEANPDLARFSLNISQQAHPDYRPQVAEMAQADYYKKMGDGLGYEPSFFEDPKRVAGIYHAWKSAPEGAEAPSWLDMDMLGQAYEYYKFRNEDKPWTEWQFLPEDDPGRGFMQALGTPPSEFLRPDEAKLYSNPQNVIDGKIMWADLAPDVRQGMLSDPTFYESGLEAFPQMARQEILQDPNFDWEQVPQWQELVYGITSSPEIMASPMALAGAQAGKMFGLTGMAVGAAAGYGFGLVGGQEYDPTKSILEQPSVAAGAMRLLNVLSEGTEQGVGFISQTIENPTILSNDEKRKAAWEVGRISYETSAFAAMMENALPALLGDARFYEKPEGKTYLERIGNAAKGKNLFEMLMPGLSITLDIVLSRGGDAQFAKSGEGFILGQRAPIDKVEAFETLVGRKVTSNTDALAAARDWFMQQPDEDVAAQTLMGWGSDTVGGMMADLAIQSTADPLNVLPEVGTQVVGKVAEMTGHQVAADAAKLGRTPKSAIETYKAQVQSGQLPDGFSYRDMPAMAQYLSEIKINEAGDPVIKSGKFSGQGLLEVPKKSVREWFGGLTPEARLTEGHHMAQNHLMQMMTMFDDLHDFDTFMKAVANADQETMMGLAGNLAASPEWYTVLPALKNFDGIEKIVSAWDASEVSRNLLWDIADRLGEEPRAVLDELARDGGIERTVRRLNEAAPLSPSGDIPPNSPAGDLGGVSVERLAGIKDLFTSEQPVPWHPDLAKAMVSNSLQQHFADWGVKYFDLKQDSIAFRLAETGKKFQGMLMLGGSPSYPINNQLSNMVMRAVTGNFGYLSPKAIDGFFKDFGYTPHDSGVGVGALGDTSLAKAGDVRIGDASVPAEGTLLNAITDAKSGGAGAWRKINDMLSATNRMMPFGRLSQFFEGLEKQQALSISMKKMWGRMWERGKGFREMPVDLVQHLEQVHPGASELIYRGFEAAMNQKQITDAIYGRAIGVKARGLVERAAQAIGKDVADARSMLEQIGVFEGLDARLQGELNQRKIDAAFAQVERIAFDNFTVMQADALQAKAQVAFDRVRVEGPQAAVDVFLDIENARTDRWLEHYIDAGETAGQVADAPPEMVGRLWEEYYRNTGDEWQRTNSSYLANMRGVMEGLGFSESPAATQLMDLFAQQFSTWDEAYKFMREQRNGHFEQWRDTTDFDARSKAYGEMEAQVDQRFREARNAEAEQMKQMGLLLSDEFARRFGPEAGKAMLNKWGDIVTFRAEMWNRLQVFRSEVVGKPKDVARRMKAEFYRDVYMPMVVEMGRLRTDFGDLKGLSSAPPVSPPNMPDGSIQGGVPSTVPGALTPSPSPEGRGGQTYAERVVADEAARAQAFQAKRSAVWDVAEGYDLSFRPFDRNVLQDKFALIAALRDEGLGGDASIMGIDDPKVTPDLVQRVMESRESRANADVADTVEQAGGSVDYVPPLTPPNIPDGSIQGGSTYTGPVVHENTSLLRAIQQHGGIDKNTYALDVTGQRNPRTAPGVWTLKGIGLDEMARRLADDGFAIDLDTPDGGIAELSEMILRAQSGEKLYPVGHDFDAYWSDQQAVWADQQIEAMQNFQGRDIWDVAAEHGYHGVDELGQPIENAALDLIKIVKRYAGDEGAAVRTMDDLTPELVNRAFVNQELFRSREITVATPEQMAQALDDMRARVARAERTKSVRERENKVLGLRQEIANAIATLPEGMPEDVVQGFVRLSQEIDGEYFNVQQRKRLNGVLEEAQRQQAVLQNKARQIVNRNMVREQLLENVPNLSENQADAAMALMDARAVAWEWETGRSAGEWYETRVAGIESGAAAEDIAGAGVSYQVGDAVAWRGKTGEVIALDSQTTKAGKTIDGVRVQFEGEGSFDRFVKLSELDAPLSPAETSPRISADAEYSGGKAPKGAVEFLDDGRAIITAFERADVTTVVHEIGHVFRRDLHGDDLATVEQWAGVKDGKWEVAHEEKFTRAFEKYLADGSAPTKALVRVFEHFKRWMSEVYRVLKGSPIDVEITPEVRAVFDKLLSEPFDEKPLVNELYQRGESRTAEMQRYMMDHFAQRGVDNSFNSRTVNSADEFVWYGDDGVAEGMISVSPEQVDIHIADWVEGREAAVEHLLQAANAYDLTPAELWQRYLESNPNRRGTAGLEIKVDQLERAQAVAEITENDWFAQLTERGKSERAKFGGVADDAPLRPSDTSPQGGEDLASDGRLFQAADERYTGPVWYSSLGDAVGDMPQAKMLADQFRAWLNKQGGIKADELKWTGFDDWLAEQDVVTREDAAQFMRENAVNVEEVTKGGFISYEEWGRERFGNNFDPDEQLFRDQYDARVGRQGIFSSDTTTSATKYEQYQLPGGENYRELLLTLPAEADVPYHLEQRKNATGETYWAAIRDADGYHLGGGATEAEAHAAAEKRTTRLEAQYQSGHWDEANVLAHTRFNERIDADGKRVLFIEEVQSDWHQAGRDKGYRSSFDASELEKYKTIAVEKDIDFNWTRQMFSNSPPSKFPNVIEKAKNNATILTGLDETQAVAKMRELSDLKKLEIENQLRVPDAPFSKTWHELVMKRMLRYAAENGFDRVAWTPGEVQAARYDLSKQINHLNYERTPDNKFIVSYETSEGAGGMIENRRPLSAEELPDYVGKDVANRMISNEGDDMGGYRQLSGDGLAVGGEGMVEFYDRMLPRFMKKYGKKWGAKVGVIELPSADNLQVLGIDVTDGMRESVLKRGQPLFQMDASTGSATGGEGTPGLYDQTDVRMPTGGYAQESGWFDEGAFMEDGWSSYVSPLLDAMRDEATRQVRDERPFVAGELDDATARDLKRYVNQVKLDMGTAKQATTRYGEGMTAFALLNYNRRYGIDKPLDMWAPYQFFYTRSAINGLARLIDKPSWFANYARLQMMQQKYENNLPERMRGKIKIPAPWQPDWMGDSLYIDPSNVLFQFSNYMQPFERMTQDKRYVEIQAERILQEWAEDGSMGMGELTTAFETHEGATWEKAMAEAAQRREYEQAGPLDMVSMMLSPAWYLKNPWYDVTGGLGGYSADTNLPITRAAQAFETVTQDTWAEPVGKFLGLFGKPEQLARGATGLEEFGDLDIYYTKRQLANMVAEGLLDTSQAEQAMIEQGATGSPTSEIWEQARERVDLEMAMRTPLAASLYAGTHEGLGAGLATLPASLFGSGLLPEGELRFRGLNEKWNAAWDAYDAGDTGALSDFFDDHPEYQAYMAKNKDEGELLRSFLVGEIWDNYMAIDKPNRKVVTGQMGNLFQQSFLNKETRSYENIDTDTLALWAKMLKGQVPQTEETASVTEMPQYSFPELEGIPAPLAASLNEYEVAKAEQFPGINDIQGIYYDTPKSERRRILQVFPQLRAYWDWRRSYLDQHPEAAQFIDSQTAEAIVRGEMEPVGMDAEQARRLLMYYRPADFAAPLRTADYYLSTASPVLNEAVLSYALLGEPLGGGAQAELQMIWDEAGRPAESLESFLDDVLVPTLGY